LVEAGATGKGGNLVITADNLSVKGGGQINAGTSSTGDGGNLSISANRIEVMAGFSKLSNVFHPSAILTPVMSPNATGNSGNLTINTQQLLIKDRGIISSYF
jgi:large exoprotein involved in heme utilization and adhesion